MRTAREKRVMLRGVPRRVRFADSKDWGDIQTKVLLESEKRRNGEGNPVRGHEGSSHVGRLL